MADHQAKGSDPLFWNKIAGAVLGTGLVIYGMKVGADLFIFNQTPPPLAQGEAGYFVAVAEGGAGPVEVVKVDIGTLLASANVAAGERVVLGKCVSCHVLQEGAAPTLGPNLHGVVGRQIASKDNWDYSGAMREHASAAGAWSYEQLNGYLERPGRHVPGTTMSFVGLLDDSQRANAIAYLASITPSAPAFPAPAAAEAPADAASAEDAAAQAPADAPAAGVVTEAAAPTSGGVDGAGEVVEAAASEAGAAIEAAVEAATETAADAASDLGQALQTPDQPISPLPQ